MGAVALNNARVSVEVAVVVGQRVIDWSIQRRQVSFSDRHQHAEPCTCVRRSRTGSADAFKGVDPPKRPGITPPGDARPKRPQLEARRAEM